MKLLPGVKAVQTPTLLAANVVASNLIRWRGGQPEKYGGWMNFFSNAGVSPGSPSNVTTPGVTRELCAWADLNLTNHIAVAGTAGLNVLTPTQNGTPFTEGITPQYAITTSLQTFTTAAGSSIVTIFDPGAEVNNYSSVQILCHVAVGGIVLFGAFPVTAMLTADQYEITLPFAAITTATTVTAPCVATFTTQANSQVIEVKLTDHGLAAGGTFSLPLPTTIGANAEVTLEGFYTVQEIIDANNFIIFAPQAVPTVATTQEANLGGNPEIVYWITQSPPLPNSGWGVGGWGVGGWGSGQQQAPLGGLPYPPPPNTPGFNGVTGDDWCLGNWGSQLISNPTNGPLFYWDPISGIQNSGVISTGPMYATGFFIGMPEQQIVAYGASVAQIQDPMLVAWCDNANLSVWTANVNNQAGTYRLTRGSKIIGGIQGPQQAMLWTDVGLWNMAYIGYPNVFGFSEVAQGCGLIGKHAVAVYGPQVFWMSRDAFWMYSNGVVQRLQCDVWDIIIKNLNNAKDTNGNYLYFGHIRGAANSGYDEVCWHFPSQASTNGENDSWVKFNPVTGEWDYALTTPQQGMVGNTPLHITAWIDQNIFGHPISSMLALNSSPQASMIMQHEMGMDANGQAINWMIQTGFFMLSDGEDKVFVDFMIPDFRWRRWQQPQSVSAQVQITLYTAEYPDDPEETWVPYGPFVVTNATGGIEPRCRGRYFFAAIQGNDLGSFVRLGGIKFRFAPDGRN